MVALKVLFWVALVALLWTHLLYPFGAAALARVRTRAVRKAGIEPAVTVIVAAYNEEPVIERRLENLLALDYPTDKLELVVTSDASTDRTHELVERFGDRVRLIVNPRGGKVAAQNRAVRETSGEIVAFSDANATWAPDALRHLVANFADPDVAYVCGQLVLEAADGSNREGLYWRYEMVQRQAESRLGSVTGGNGSIYAVRRSDYVEVDPKWGHDLAFPYRMVQAGRRAVYEPAARASEKPTPSNETRVPAQGAHVRALLGDHAARVDAQAPPLRLPGRGDLPQGPSLRQRRPPPRPAGDVACARPRGARLPGRARCAARSDRGRTGRRRHRPLLRTRDLGDRRRALELPTPRRARDVGGGGGHALNRTLDVAIAGTGLALASPVLALAALAVKLGDGGPVLFKQVRVGKDGEDFELLKLRTMVVGAETRGAGYAVDRATAGSRVSAASSAARRSTSCRSSGTSCAET